MVLHPPDSFCPALRSLDLACCLFTYMVRLSSPSTLFVLQTHPLFSLSLSLCFSSLSLPLYVLYDFLSYLGYTHIYIYFGESFSPVPFRHPRHRQTRERSGYYRIFLPFPGGKKKKRKRKRKTTRCSFLYIGQKI